MAQRGVPIRSFAGIGHQKLLRLDKLAAQRRDPDHYGLVTQQPDSGFLKRAV